MQIVYAPNPVPDATGVYVDITQPAPAQAPVTAPLTGFVFESLKGETDVAYDLTSLADFEYFFGGPGSSVSPSAGHLDARVFYEIYPGARLRGVRVASALLSSGSLTVLDGSAGTICSLQATPGSWANTLAFSFTQNDDGTWGFTVSDPNNPSVPGDTFINLPSTTSDGSTTAAKVVAAINAQNPQLVTASLPLLTAISAPTLAATAGGGNTVPQAATWYGLVAYTTSGGKVQAISEVSTTALSGGAGKLTLTVPALSGATGWEFYAATSSGKETLAATGTTFGSGVDILAAWAASTQKPPTSSTATVAATSTTFLGAAGAKAIPSSAGATGRPGTDGAGSGAARHLGDTTSGPSGGPSGAHALFGFDADPELIFFAGTASTDTSVWTALGTLCSVNGAVGLPGFAVGQTSSQVRATVAALTSLIAPATAAGQALKACWPAAKVNDPDVGLQIVPSVAYFAAITARTPRQRAAYNKPLTPGATSSASDIGWSFAGPEIAPSTTDIALLTDPTAGIYVNVLTPRIPATGTGFKDDNMLSPKAAGVAQDSFEVRVRSYLAAQLYRAGGAYFGFEITDDQMAQTQHDLSALLDMDAAAGLIPRNDPGASSTTPSVPVTTAKSTKTTTSAGAATPSSVATAAQQGSGSYVAYQVVCDRSVNGPATMAAGQLIAVVSAAIAPNAKQVIFVLNAGVGVTISTSAA